MQEKGHDAKENKNFENIPECFICLRVSSNKNKNKTKRQRFSTAPEEVSRRETLSHFLIKFELIVKLKKAGVSLFFDFRHK